MVAPTAFESNLEAAQVGAQNNREKKKSFKKIVLLPSCPLFAECRLLCGLRVQPGGCAGGGCNRFIWFQTIFVITLFPLLSLPTYSLPPALSSARPPDKKTLGQVATASRLALSRSRAQDN